MIDMQETKEDCSVYCGIDYCKGLLFQWMRMSETPEASREQEASLKKLQDIPLSQEDTFLYAAPNDTIRMTEQLSNFIELKKYMVYLVI